jgi:hypothetical protein
MNSLIDFIREDKEILFAESPNQAYDWACKIRSNIKGTKEENLLEVLAEGHRVIMTLKPEGKAMKKIRATCSKQIDLKAKVR